jgi:hypothetical protein
MSELLTVSQCSYILSKSIFYVTEKIKSGKFEAIKKKRGSYIQYFIEQEELENIIKAYIIQNERVIKFINLDFDAIFWKQNGYRGYGKQIEINGRKYITVSQLAFLFKISRQAVHKIYLNKQKLTYITINDSSKKTAKKLIDVHSLNERIKPLRKMLMYISEPDKSKFWQLHKKNIYSRK